MLFQRAQLFLVLLRVLESQTRGRIGHQGLVMLDYLASAAAEDVDNLLYVIGIFLLGHFADAGSPAFANVELEAGAEFAPEDGVGGYLERAGAKLVNLVEEVHQVAGVHNAAVRAKVAVALALLYAACDEHARELLPGDADPGVRLGVLQEYVVLGLVLLDEVVLQEERIGLRVHHGELRIGVFANQDACFGVQPLRRHKILRHPLVQVLGLPHINNLSLGVIISIDAGGMGK